MKVFIYCLINPINKKPFYVGASTNPKKRLNGHMQIATKMPFAKGNIYSERRKLMIKILSKGKKPILKIIEETTFEKADERERYVHGEMAKKYKLIQYADGFFNYSKGKIKHKIKSKQ